MRTTLSIDDDLLEHAKRIARSRRVSLGRVVSELMRRGLEPQIEDRDAFPVFEVSSTATPITGEKIREAEDTW